MELWAKDAAPTAELRKAFHQGGLPWDEFEAAYRAELASNPHLDVLRAELSRHPESTLLYGAHDPSATTRWCCSTFWECDRIALAHRHRRVSGSAGNRVGRLAPIGSRESGRSRKHPVDQQGRHHGPGNLQHAERIRGAPPVERPERAVRRRADDSADSIRTVTTASEQARPHQQPSEPRQKPDASPERNLDHGPDDPDPSRLHHQRCAHRTRDDDGRADQTTENQLPSGAQFIAHDGPHTNTGALRPRVGLLGLSVPR